MRYIKRKKVKDKSKQDKSNILIARQSRRSFKIFLI